MIVQNAPKETVEIAPQKKTALKRNPQYIYKTLIKSDVFQKNSNKWCLRFPMIALILCYNGQEKQNNVPENNTERVAGKTCILSCVLFSFIQDK